MSRMKVRPQTVGDDVWSITIEIRNHMRAKVRWQHLAPSQIPLQGTFEGPLDAARNLVENVLHGQAPWTSERADG